MERLKLAQGDCFSLLNEIPEGSVDMVLCDPPYGITRNKWDEALDWQVFWKQLYRVCKPNAAILLFSSSKFSYDLVATNRKDFRYKFIWVKTRGTGFLNANRMPIKTFEEINVFYRTLPTFNPVKSFGHKPYVAKRYAQRRAMYDSMRENITEVEDGSRYPTDVLYFASIGRGKGLDKHPNEKPVDLLEQLIRFYTNKGDVVLDPTMGSGSTGEAALNLERNFIGFEREAKYYEAAAARLGY